MRNRVRQLRDLHGIESQADLGDMIGVHWQTISRIENTKTRIMPKHEKALAKAFGVEIMDLYLDPGAASEEEVQEHILNLLDALSPTARSDILAKAVSRATSLHTKERS